MNGKLNISIQLVKHDDRVILRLEDRDACVSFFDCTLSPAQVMGLLSGGYIQAEAILRGLEHVGSQHRCKTINVVYDVFETDKAKREAKKKAILKKIEVDGWRANVDDFENGHRRIKGGPDRGKQMIALHRNVPKKKGTK